MLSLRNQSLLLVLWALMNNFRKNDNGFARHFMMKTRIMKVKYKNHVAQFKRNVFNVTLDGVISEVTRRFGTSEQLKNMFLIAPFGPF